MTDTTQTRILDAAEELFARRGFDGTSIREITSVAGVNVAAVHYHFGSKEAVLRGVTDRISGVITDRRSELLAALSKEPATDPPSIDVILDAFIRADIEILLELQERGPTVARFLGRTYGDQTPWIQEMAREQYMQTAEFYPMLIAALPRLTENEIEWRIRQVVAVIVHLFATWPEDGMNETEAETLLGRLVVFLSAGLEAPMAGARSRNHRW